MNVGVVADTRTRALETAGPVAPGSHASSFQEMLRSICEPPSGTTPPLAPQPSVLPPSDTIVVRPGDCLSRICSDRLKARGGLGSQREISAAIRIVAKANHIADPDRISIGQKLDLSMLANFASRQDVPRVQECASNWTSLVEGPAALSSAFGLRKDPFSGRVKPHEGIDVAARSGAPISAFAAGTVTFSGWKSGYGNTVVIRHEDGLESLYGHVSKSLVHVGEQVASHTPIARVGSTGRSTGAHLHFEVRKNLKAMDPTLLLNGYPLQTA